MPQLTIDAEVLAIEPHPDQATHNPGCWAVQFRVSHAGETRTFWRWHSVRKLNENGAWIDPGNEPPTADEILKAFWDDTFNELHGFRRDVLFNNHDESIEMSKKTAKPAKKKIKPAAKTVAAKKKPKAKAPVKAKASAKAAKRPAAKKAARKPPPKPSPSPIAISSPTIASSQDAAPALYYPDYEPKGEERDFAPLVGYFSEATDAEDLRKRMLFRAQIGNHPEDVLVAGKRKALTMGWDIDLIDVGQPLAMGFLVPTPAPEQSEVSTVAPEQPEASTVEPEQPEAPTVEPEQPEMTMAPEQSEATAPEQAEAPVTEPEQHSATEVAAAVIEASMSDASETSAAIDPEESPQ